VIIFIIIYNMGCSNSSRAEEPVRMVPVVEEGPRRVNLADFSMDPLAMSEYDDFAQDKFSVNIVSQERIKDAIIKLSIYGESLNTTKPPPQFEINNAVSLSSTMRQQSPMKKVNLDFNESGLSRSPTKTRTAN
jgi:hypothetical protein